MKTPTIRPDQWRRRRQGRRGPCYICGCPIGNCGEHRRVPVAENADHVWERRKKGPTGWQYFPIGSRRTLELQAAKQELRRKSKPGVGRLLRRNSLVKFFYGKFLPAKALQWSPHTARWYRRAFLKFLKFAGRDDVSLGSVDERTTDRFRDWLIECGTGTEEARQLYAHIRAIARAARSGASPKPGRPPKAPLRPEPVDPLDMEGSLLCFALHVYFPERMNGATILAKDQIIIAVRDLCRRSGHNVMLADLSDELISSHMGQLLEEEYSRKTINNRRASILALWRYVHKKKLVETYPTVDKLPEFRRLPTAWTIDQLNALLAACQATPGTVDGLIAADFWTALVLVIYDTAIRWRAALSIERSDLDLGTGWLCTPAEIQKERVEQRFQISQQATDAVRKIWDPPRRLLFPWSSHRCIRRIWRDFGEILHRAGLPNTRRDKFQRIRRTTASYIAAAAGIEAAGRQLGHANATMTERYVDPTIARAHLDGAAWLPRPGQPARGNRIGQASSAVLSLPAPEGFGKPAAFEAGIS